MVDKPVEWTGARWRSVVPREKKEEERRVIDVHFHVFPRLGTGANMDIRLKLLQYHHRDRRIFWRRADGTRVDRPLLEFPSDDIYAMPDLSFRIANYGQAEFTLDGVDYYLQAWPPNLQTMTAPPEQMVAEMDVAGIDMGVLQQDHVYGSLNEYFGECGERFPGRFIGLAQVREWRADQDEELERLEQAIVEHGNKGLYFAVESFALNNYADHIDDAKFEPLWERVRALGIPVFWYLDSRVRDRLSNYMQRLAELTHWAEAHPDIPSVITHGIVPAILISEIGIPNEAMTLLKRPNMHAELLAPAKSPEYPYPEGQELIRRLCGEVGAEKLMWGSDMPFTWYWCTYKQSVDYIRFHCDFLSEDERGLILGGNAARLFGIE